MNKTKLQIIYEKIDCLICESSEYKLLNIRQKTIETINYFFEFENNEVLCLKCGLIYTNPIPTQDSLNTYYRDKTLNIGLPDYNMENRLALFKKINKSDKSTIVEIGSNNGSFVNELDKLFKTVYGIEIENKDNTNSIDNVRDNSVDIFVMNHVLEHIPKPVDFLKLLSNKLKNNGLLICEVPVVENYMDVDNNALYHEHLIHFTEKTLKSVFLRSGYETVITEKTLVSRPVGLTLIVRKNKKSNQNILRDKKSNQQFVSALKFEESKNLKKILFIDTILKNSKGKIGVWGANEFLDLILCHLEKNQLKNFIAFDKSNEKNGKIFGTGKNKIKVCSPLNYNKINTLSAVIICAVSWEKEIREELINFGLNKNKIFVFPY